jgi:hypothetical protein
VTPWWKRATLRDVLLLTVPPMALALYVFVSACLDYHRIRQYDDWWARTGGVSHYTELRLRSAASTLTATELRERIANDYESVDTLRLRIDQGAWDRIGSDVGATWGRWIEASIEDAGDVHPVEVRLRGDNSVHWTSEKKSISIKTSRDRLYKGHRELIFSLKTVLSQHLTNSLAQDFDLLGPRSDVVPLYVNNQYYGIFRFIEPVDESFLRRNERMPGNIFRADAAVRGERFKNMPRAVFQNPYAWERVAENARPGAPEGVLFGFLTDLARGTAEDHVRFMGHFDRSELARLFALMLFTGDPYHMSDIHNQLWYEDPSSGRLHPIVWDLRLLRLDEPRERFTLNQFWHAALRDPQLLDETLRYVAGWLEDDRFDRLTADRAQSVNDRYADHFAYDFLRAGVIYASPTPDVLMNFLRDNLETLREWTGDARVAAHVERSGETTWTLDLRASGYSGSELVALTTDDTAAGLELRADSNLNGVLDDSDRVISTTQDASAGRTVAHLEKPEVLLPGWAGSGSDLITEPLHYRFFLTADSPLENVGVELRRRIGGEPLAPATLDVNELVPARISWHPFELERPAPQDVRLTGQVRLTEDLIVAEGARLTIEAGTDLALDPGVSILVRGQLAALGTAERPIRVRAATDSPWGVFALQGAGANGSRLAFVGFERGGGALLEGVEYKGSVCVYGAEDVQLTDCTLADNERCDDLLNVVSSGVDLVRCQFTGANADAVDYDLSTGSIVECVISGAPNDGIDLMTSSPRILATRIENCGDKGMSFGEDCAPLVFDCDVSGCARGLEVKDFSAPILLSSRITGNALGLLQQSKNWRYGGGGRAKLVSSLLADNTEDYRGDDGSLLTVASTDDPWVRHLFGVEGSRPQFLIERRFEEGFNVPSDAWRTKGSVRTLEVRERELVARLRRGTGAVAEAVALELPAGPSGYVLVLEAAGEGLTEAALVASGPNGQLSCPLNLAPEADRLSYTVLELPPGKYDGFAVRARATDAGGALRIHGYRVFDLPRRHP